MAHQIHQTQSFFSAGAVVFQEDPTKPDFTNPSTNSISDTWNRWKPHTIKKQTDCSNMFQSKSGSKCQTRIIPLLFPPLDPIQWAILTIFIIWAGFMATHSSSLYFYGLLSRLIDRVWLFNSTATPPRAGWLYDNGWSGIWWYFLVFRLDPENREI